MSVDFLNISKKSLKANLLQKAASFLDENTDDVKEGMYYTMSLIYSAIAHNINRGKTATIFTSIKEFQVQNITEAELEDLFNGQNSLLFEKSYELLKVIFDNDASEIKELISNSSHIHKESVISLLKMVLPLVLKPINKRIQENKLDEKGFETMMNSNKNCLYKHISADFLNKIVHDLGFYTLDYNTATNKSFNSRNNKNNKNIKFLKLLSSFVLIAIAGWFVFKSKSNEEKSNLKTQTEEINLQKIANLTLDDEDFFYHPTKQTIGKYIKNYENLGFFKKRTLKNGKEILVLSNGGVNNFINYLEEDKPINKKIWFSLHRVFVKDKEDFDIEKSKSEIDNLLKVLNAYPNIGIKIGGLTDNEGPADINFQKSYKIAEKFMNLLIEKGISADRLKYEGYGENYPIKDNDSNQKHLNNRLSFRLTKK